MKKYFVITDIHGFYNEMKLALDKEGFDINNKNHILISLGDLLDRGDQPKECLAFVNMLPKDRKILIKGNHEELMIEILKCGHFGMHDYHNGTVKTLLDLYTDKKESEYIEELTLLNFIDNYDPWNTYYSNLVDYAEIGDKIFVHGWIPENPDSKYQCEYYDDWRNGDWNDARWHNGMADWHTGLKIPNKTIYCGHWHTSYGHSILHEVGSEFGEDAHFEPFIDDGIVALDACTAYSGFCNCVTFEGDD